jgi:hypothetical protein
MLTCDCVTPVVGLAAEPFGVGAFEIGYVTDDGLEHRVSQAWATPFESCSPIRRFTSHKGQRHLSGPVVGHDRRPRRLRVVDERDHVMALDFDPTVVGIASWRDEAAKLISHAPDFFARRADGTSVVVEMQAGRGLPVSTGRRRWRFGSVGPVLGP